ncbi:hypothetical protein RYX36_001923 [Vicia faba]
MIHPLEFPLELDQILDLEMAFKVKWQSRWKNCTVFMILKNDPFIKQLSAQLETIEIKKSVDEAKLNAPEKSDLVTITFISLPIKESVDEAKPNSPEESDLVTVTFISLLDLEIKSKHNPDPITHVGKRQFPDASSESTSSEGFCDEELSSNKLKKIIKVEKKD